MADKKKGAQAKSKVKSIATKQRTLYDLFPKQISLASNAPAEILQERHDASLAPNPVALVPSSPRVSEEVSTTIVEKLRQASLEPRPIHPFFAKATRFVQSGTPSEKSSTNIPQDMVIEITDEEYPSTSNTTPDELTELLPLTQEGGSQQDPIVLDSPPVKKIRLRNPRTSNKPPAPLFARLPPKTSALVTVTSRSKAIGSQAPYPDRTSQHIRGPQHTFDTPYLPCGRRARRVAQSFKETSGETSRLLKNLTESKIYPSISPRYTSFAAAGGSNLTATPIEDLNHPAIARFSTQSKHSSTHRLWAAKWRPTRAAEVLGNEANGLYLRDWLSAHDLHLAKDTGSGQEESAGRKAKDKADIRGTKRPRVVRAVEKRRGRKKRKFDSDDEDEDDWIVYSDASEANDYLDRDSDGGRPSPPLPHEDSTGHQPSLPAPISDRHSNARQSFDQLTNTILLAGPSGSGKTAAVYACAEELGWEVFEVYPGLGKRNAPGIDSFIGDAGKNHHVRKMRTGDAGISEGRNALNNVFSRSSREHIVAEETVVDIEVAHPPSHDLGFTSPNSADMTEAAPFVRQSLILLEEVDILFKEDGSFWPAVTNFIKDCKRPVVCTCNDISLVPTRDLPLQAILDFKPCSPALAASYLQGLCSAEGYTLERNTSLQLYEDSVSKPDSLDIPDLPTPPTSDSFPAQDLRRTINCLQFRCSSADSEIEHTSGWETLSDTGEDLCDWNRSIEQRSRKSPDELSADQSSFATAMRTEAPPRRLLAAHHADTISFVDSHLMRRPWDTPGALAWRDCKPSNDDEIGHTILFYPRHAEEVSFGLRDQDEEIASTAMWLSRGALEVGRTREPTSIGISPFRTRELFRARVDHQLRMAKALGDIVPLSILKMRRVEVQMDYEGSIRDIVATEDMEELAHLRKQCSGRMTRNSGGGFVRTLLLTMESRTALTETVLPPI